MQCMAQEGIFLEAYLHFVLSCQFKQTLVQVLLR